MPPRPPLPRLVLAALAVFMLWAAIAPAIITKADGTTFNATAGQEFNGRVATFTSDSKIDSATGYYRARIFWGDGTESDGTFETLGGSGASTDYEVRGKHTYSNGGTCEVTVQISEISGPDFREVKSTANVSGPPGPSCSKEPPPEPPTADLALPKDKRTGTPLVLYSLSKPGSSPLVAWHWDFGDGKTADFDASPGHATHIYDDPGTYTVTLTVTDSKGLKSTATGQVTVKATPQPVITFSPKKPLTTDDVHFSGQKSKVDGGKIVRWEWECKGVKTTRIDSNDIKKGLPKYKARCKFGKAKNPSVRLTVTSDSGDTATLSQSMPIKLKRPPHASFNFSPHHPEQDQTVTFDASKSKSDPLGDGKGITSYRWEFSDGTDETTTTPIFKHKFTGDIGTRTLTLTVKDKEGKTTIEDSVYVSSKCVNDLVVRGVNVRADCMRKRNTCGEKTNQVCWSGLPGAVVKLNGVELKPPAHAPISVYESGRVNAGLGDYAPTFAVTFGSFSIAQPDEFTIPAGGGPKTPDGDWAIDGGKLHGLSFSTDPLLFHPNGTSSIGANVKLPPPVQVASGRVELSASNDGPPFLGALHLEAHDIPLPPFHLNSAVFDYSEAGDRWFGSLSVQSPSGTFGGSIELLGGSLNHLGLFGDNLNYPLGQGVFLQHLSGSYTVKPTRVNAEVGISVGPQLSIPGAGTGNLMGFNGTFDLSFPAEGGWTTTLGGTASVIGVDVGQVDASLNSAGRFTANVHFNTTLYTVFDVNAHLGIIYYEPNYFAAQALIDICTKYIVHECAGGELVISSVGIGACIYLPGVLPNVGGYFNWKSGAVEFFFSGCSVGPVQIQIARIRPAQARTFTVRKGTSSEALQFVGEAGPPRVTLVGPKGERVATPDDGYELSKDAMVSQEAKDRSTYVLLGKPSPGKWTVEVAPGSTPVIEMKRAQGIPEPSVKARVGGSGASRKLTYSARAVKGQRITFYEEGASRKRIGSTRSARGAIAFAPGDGPRGKRTITAEILQNGKVRKMLKVATYSAPRVVPGKPARLKLRRKGSGLQVSWGKAPGASGYSLQVVVSDGRRIPILTPRSSVTIPGFAKTESATVTVAGYRVAGLNGPAAKATLKPAKRRR